MFCSLRAAPAVNPQYLRTTLLQPLATRPPPCKLGAFESMSASSNWPRNRLLLALPSPDLQQLTSELEQINCQHAQVLMEADSSLDHVFFPDSGVISAVTVYADGSIIEMATIGREGCTAVASCFGARVLLSGCCPAPRGRGKNIVRGFA